MTVKELIEELKKHNPDAEIKSITVGMNDQWDYTDNPKIEAHKNIFGEWVFIE